MTENTNSKTYSTSDHGVVVHLDDTPSVLAQPARAQPVMHNEQPAQNMSSSRQDGDTSSSETPHCLFDMTPEQERKLKEQLREYVDGNEAACPFKKTNQTTTNVDKKEVIDYGYQAPRDDNDWQDQIITTAATRLLMETPSPDLYHKRR